MKNRIGFWLLALGCWLLIGSCTLNMEEWEQPEEEKGFDEPNTIETGVGTVTYQFNEGTIYVSDNVQEYLTTVEHDSILYFLPNMPEKSKPVVGSKLASGSTHKLPRGLNHLVLSVEDVGGLIKVVCTKTSVENVYKSLSYCIDADLVYRDVSGLTDEQLEALGYERRDSIIYDWAIYDSIKGINTEKLKLRRRLEAIARRRGSEEDSDKSYNVSSSFDREILNWYIDSRKILGIKKGVSKMAEACKNLEDAIMKQLEAQKKVHPLMSDYYVALSLKVLKNIKVHSERDSETKYELHYTDTWHTVNVGLQAGVEATLKPRDELSQDKIGKSVAEWSDGNGRWKSLQTSVGNKKLRADLIPERDQKNPFDIPEVHFVLPGPAGVGVFFGATVEPRMSMGGSACISGSYTTDVVRTGYEVKHGVRRDIKDEVISEGNFKLANIVGDIHFDLGFYTRGYVGIEVGAGVLACTLGVNFDCSFSGNFTLMNTDDEIDLSKFGLYGQQDTKISDMWELYGSARFLCQLYGDVQLHIRPFGMSFFDQTLGKFGVTRLIDYNTNASPKILYQGGVCNETEKGVFYAGGYFSLSKSNDFQGIVRVTNYYPYMLMYIGPMKDKNVVLMTPNESYGPIKGGETYYFNYVGELPKGTKELHFRPFFYAPDVPMAGVPSVIFGKPDDSSLVNMGKPDIITLHSAQLCGQPFNDMDYFLDPKNDYFDTEDGRMGSNTSIDYTKVNLRQYKFYTKVNVMNGSQLKRWGIKVRIFNPNGKQLLYKKVGVSKLGTGDYYLVFNFITNWELTGSNQQMSYSVQPYWTDKNDEKGEATDGPSTQKYYLDYESTDISEHFSPETLGKYVNVLPEYDLGE